MILKVYQQSFNNSENLQNNYGLDVEINWLGKGNQNMPGGLTISEAKEAHQHKTEIHRSRWEACSPKCIKRCVAGPDVKLQSPSTMQ